MINTRGYIAVICAISITSILSLIVLLNSTIVFWTRLEQMHRESHLINRNLAKACTYEALLQYSEDPNSTLENEVIPFDSNLYCIIDSVATTSTNQSFTAHAYQGGTYAGVIVGTSKDPQTGTIRMTSWRDITSIPP